MTSGDVKRIIPGIIPIQPPKEAVLVYYDETEIHWCPDLGKGYQSVHQQNRILSPGEDRVKYLLGGVVYPTGEGLYQIFDHKRTMEVESYLVSWCDMWPKTFIFLIWDNARTHTTALLQPFFEAYQEQLLPVY
ncbi:transposase [Candidatus Poribacteria bacterium]|nr:transposase [Candidatus Poribacteria bacterium]